MGKGLEQTFLQERLTNGQQVYEKTFDNSNHQRNANQNHNNEISPHTCQDGHYQTQKQNKTTTTKKQTNKK